MVNTTLVKFKIAYFVLHTHTIVKASRHYFDFEQFKVSLALCGLKRQKPSIAVMIAVMRGRLRVGEERRKGVLRINLSR